MSFKGLDFIRQWAKEHIYKARVLGQSPRSAPDLAETFRKDGRPTAQYPEIMGTTVGDAG
jgi:hypothetical protein